MTHVINPASIRSGILVMSASNGMRSIVENDEAKSLHFSRECSMGKHLGFPLSDDLLVQAFRFQRVDDTLFQKHLRDGRIVKLEKQTDGYYIFGIKVEVAHLLQGLFFFATNEELTVA